MISIIGFGFVGQAVASILKENPLILDPFYNKSVAFEKIKKSDMIFICVPTPTIDNHCDDSLIMEYIEKLKGFKGVVVIKSTCPLKTIKKVIEIRPKTIIWPELLREKFAKTDIKNPNIIVIGAKTKKEFMKIKDFIESKTMISHKKNNTSIIHHVKPEEASIFKYTVNAFLATKVVFMHQMYAWLEHQGIGNMWKNIANLLELEGRVGASHLKAPGQHGLGFSGSCFPKDTQALLSQSQDDGFELKLLKNVILENKKLQKKNKRP